MKNWILKWLIGKEKFNEIEKETNTLYQKLFSNDWGIPIGEAKAKIRKHLLKARYK